jgi:3-oxoacyl-(acyl-carrier-protein) synthase/acyl carrier protein
MERDIAIIGIAGRFPEACNIDQLFENLCQGKDSIREITKMRVSSTSLPENKTYKSCGYLEDIDKFDYRFFNLSLAEAQSMDPNQRLLLEVVHEMFDNAGYSIDDFDGTQTAVFAGDIDLEYYRLANEITPLLVTGNTRSFLATRISRVFNLVGSSVTIDTTCSSSLVALNYACNELMLGDADHAIVCGSNVELFPFKTNLVGVDLESQEGKSKSFSRNADGMAWGEMTIAVLLKPIKKAIADNDNIHAIIKAATVNNDARRSSSLTSPDSLTQAELIRTAWKKAGISPLDIGFIEAHGSATQLGDSIEAEGLNQAFSDFTKTAKICNLSSIKANIGHGRSAAGLAGLVKAVLSLKNKIFFPALYADIPSELIDFENSPIYLDAKSSEWSVEPGRKRYAGVSSIGITGTNSHVILEEAPENHSKPALHKKNLFLVSGKSKNALIANLKALKQRLEASANVNMTDTSFTLSVGRKHYLWRTSFIANSRENLIELITQKLYLNPDNVNDSQSVNTLFLLFFPIENDVTDVHNYFLSYYPLYASQYHLCLSHFDGDSAAVQKFAFQFGLYKLLEAHGIVPERISGIGHGEKLVSLITGDITLEEAAEKIQSFKREEPLNYEKIQSFIRRESTSGLTIFIEMGPGGPFSKIYESLGLSVSGSSLFKLCIPATEDPLLDLANRLYQAGYDINWRQFFHNSGGRRIALPGYQFERTRCWIREEAMSGFYNPDSAVFAELNTQDQSKVKLSDVEYKLMQYWREELGHQRIELQDNFFEIGGDSLKATRIINRIRNQYGIRLHFEDIFDYSTLSSLGAYIESLLSTSQRVMGYWKEVLKHETIKPEDNFFELGGHSLIATQIINRVREGFGVDLNFESFFQHPTVKSFSSYIDECSVLQEKVRPGEIVKVPEAAHYEMSHAQKRLWILSQLEGGSVAYNIPDAYEFEGELDREAFSRSWSSLIDRHEVLRTVFVTVEGEPRQRVLSTGGSDFRLEYSDLRSLSGEEKTRVSSELVDEEVNRVFDLEQGPLLRARLIQTDSQRYVFVFVMHHIISDGWSMNVLVKEVLSLYESYRQGKGDTLPPLKIQYKDYAHWQNRQLEGDSYKRHREYWLKQIHSPNLLKVAPDFKRPALKTFNGKIYKYSLGAPIYDRAMVYGKQNKVTTFMVMTAAIQSLLYLETLQEDLLIGSPVSGRTNKQLEEQLGMYTNTVLLRSFISKDYSFSTILDNTKNTLHKANEHQEYPFDLLVKDLKFNRSANHSALFEIGFTYHDWKSPLADFHLSFKIKELEFEFHYVKTDLWFHIVIQQNDILLAIEYNTDLFSKERIMVMAEKFKALLQFVLATPAAKISTWNIQTDVEKNRVVQPVRFEFDFN